jgi:hypothetical protein
MKSSGNNDVVVTPEMIKAGSLVLAEDGQMSEYCAEGIVAEIFLAMWAARPQNGGNVG